MERSSDGTFSVVHPFDTQNGVYPVGGVTLRDDGFLYGTTSQGGSGGYGTIFRVAIDGSGFVVDKGQRTCAGADP